MYVETPLKTEEFDFTKIEVIETPINDPVLDVLQKALARVSRPGAWIKGALHRRIRNPKTGKEIYGYCMIGAIQAGRSSRIYQREAEKLVELLLPREYDNDIPSFNDSDETRFDDVVSVFEKAIKNRERNARR